HSDGADDAGIATARMPARWAMARTGQGDNGQEPQVRMRGRTVTRLAPWPRSVHMAGASLERPEFHLEQRIEAPRRSFAVTHRSVFAIALPMTLAYLTTPLLGLVDTAVVGRFGDAALLGGLAAGALVLSVVLTTLNFLRSGT